MITTDFISLAAMSILYILAGAAHFVKPSIFIEITPKWVTAPQKVNLLVGTIELILGISLLFEPARSIAALGVIVLLLAVFPANVYQYKQAKKNGKFIIPTLLRLPIQAVLIYWAYTFV